MFNNLKLFENQVLSFVSEIVISIVLLYFNWFICSIWVETWVASYCFVSFWYSINNSLFLLLSFLLSPVGSLSVAFSFPFAYPQSHMLLLFCSPALSVFPPSAICPSVSVNPNKAMTNVAVEIENYCLVCFPSIDEPSGSGEHHWQQSLCPTALYLLLLVWSFSKIRDFLRSKLMKTFSWHFI